MNEKIALIRAHQKNIERYRTLLKTELQLLEVQFLERRLAEERFAIAKLRFAVPNAASPADLPRSEAG